MDGYVVHGGIRLGRGTLARIEEGAGMLVYVWDGELWITQEGDRRDYFVRGGQWFRVDRGGATLLHVMSRAGITLSAPVPTAFARRISLVLPGTRVPRVLYEHAREPLRQRLARLWAGAFAPLSRPTTAAL